MEPNYDFSRTLSLLLLPIFPKSPKRRSRELTSSFLLSMAEMLPRSTFPFSAEAS